MIGKIPGFKGSRRRLITLNDGSFNPWTLEPSNPLVEAMNNKGFTLIEIIILVVLAGIIIPVIVVPFATGIRGSNKPEMVATAMYLAHQEMEELMKFDYCQASLNTGTTAMAPAPAPFSNYQWGWTISYVTNTFATSIPDVGYKQIVVTVTDPQGSTYNVYSVVTH